MWQLHRNLGFLPKQHFVGKFLPWFPDHDNLGISAISGVGKASPFPDSVDFRVNNAAIQDPVTRAGSYQIISSGPAGHDRRHPWSFFRRALAWRPVLLAVTSVPNTVTEDLPRSPRPHKQAPRWALEFRMPNP